MRTVTFPTTFCRSVFFFFSVSTSSINNSLLRKLNSEQFVNLMIQNEQYYWCVVERKIRVTVYGCRFSFYFFFRQKEVSELFILVYALASRFSSILFFVKFSFCCSSDGLVHSKLVIVCHKFALRFFVCTLVCVCKNSIDIFFFVCVRLLV